MKALRRRGANLIEGSLDVVAMLDENTFVTGGDSGAISLWHKSRKKPIFTQHLAHGVDEQQQQQQQDALNPCWITALATLPLSDMFVSGSWDGWVRVWKLVRDKRQSFELVNAIKVPGFVNSIDLFEDHESKGRGDTKVLSVEPNNVCMVLGIGQEPRMGRWARTKETRNHVRVITLRPYWVKKKQVQEEGA
ncbi:pre-rRNA processing protein [Spiromyces aspiralis]|uniref:Pre-rRNA processing protein n=1 Tax=Spiromyces aspiralis TaxID=68401 RepID=A0ACC1HNB5_9FUNG|nr:pre-rRNA processing protein [Spiromyces aspiralis]